MTIPEESQSPIPSSLNGAWYRRLFQAPHRASWVIDSFQKLTGQQALPPLRSLQLETDGSWSVEEFVSGDFLPLSIYLTQSAAPVWVFVSIVQQCLAGLVPLHQAGLMHGALSHGTIRVDGAGNVRLTGCGGGLSPPEWLAGADTAETTPALPPALAAADLRDLGRALRSVLGGTPDVKITAIRPDIAPLLAEWIDWLADPPAGREAASAIHAESVFADIRSGRPGWKPWQNKAELPPEIAGGPWHSVGDDHQTTRPEKTHTTRFEWRTLAAAGLVILALVAGAVWALNRYAGNWGGQNESTAQAPVLPGDPRFLNLPDEFPEEFESSDGDIEATPETRATIAKLMDVLGEPPPITREWEDELKEREKKLERITGGENPAAVFKESSFLPEPTVFPPIGTPSAGREPGDYYLVWRTESLVMTYEETRSLQSAILRSARYCGLRLLAWAVLPNQAGVVIRVPPPRPLSDEQMERRIALLRDAENAAEVMKQLKEKLKDGDEAGAKLIRRKWTASMGSAVGFLSVIRAAPITDLELPKDTAFWRTTPDRLALLDPDTLEVRFAAALVDTAAVKGNLVKTPAGWPLCSLTAALHNYGPARRAISILMQKNPRSSLPLPLQGDLDQALLRYRRFVGDLPANTPVVPPPPTAGGTPAESPNNNPQGDP